jgi:hypothetical protein
VKKLKLEMLTAIANESNTYEIGELVLIFQSNLTPCRRGATTQGM